MQLKELTRKHRSLLTEFSNKCVILLSPVAPSSGALPYYNPHGHCVSHNKYFYNIHIYICIYTYIFIVHAGFIMLSLLCAINFTDDTRVLLAYIMHRIRGQRVWRPLGIHIGAYFKCLPCSHFSVLGIMSFQGIQWRRWPQAITKPLHVTGYRSICVLHGLVYMRTWNTATDGTGIYG